MRYSKLLLSVIVVFAIVLTGCESASAPAEAPQEEAAMAEDEVVTITWWLETGTPQD